MGLERKRRKSGKGGKAARARHALRSTMRSPARSSASSRRGFALGSSLGIRQRLAPDFRAMRSRASPIRGSNGRDRLPTSLQTASLAGYEAKNLMSHSAEISNHRVITVPKIGAV